MFWLEVGIWHLWARILGKNYWQFFLLLQHFSRMMAMPWPPPMQAEPTAYLPPRRLLKQTAKIIQSNLMNRELLLYTARIGDLSSWTRWAVIRVPEAPRGCPMAIAPPLTLVFSGSRPRALATARYWGANASFTWAKNETQHQLQTFSHNSINKSEQMQLNLVK